jgi:hypothetical protein
MGEPVCKRKTSVCFFVNKWIKDNSCLHDEQTVKELRKIAWASVFPCEIAAYTVYIKL